MNVWVLCDGVKHIKPLAVEPWRVVEAQHVLSTRDLVDTASEHDMLEALLETSKPFIHKDKNYLIFTPFRYPPLKHGSRFGRMFEPSLWYGSLQLETAFAEVAYYQMLFHKNTSAQLDYIEMALTAFNTSLKTQHGIDLTEAPFYPYTHNISDKHSHVTSQMLGSLMRESQVAAFIYFAARTQHPSKNVAAFTPEVFSKKHNQYVFHQQTWTCMASTHTVEFTRMDVSGKKRYSFTDDA